MKDARQDSWSSLDATRTAPPGFDEEQQARWEEEWQAWWERHGLQSCRNGGLFPDVFMRRWRDLIEVSWGRSSIAGVPAEVRFLASRGFARLEPTLVATSLYAALGDAASRLLQKAPDSPRLHLLRSKVDAIQQ